MVQDIAVPVQSTWQTQQITVSNATRDGWYFYHPTNHLEMVIYDGRFGNISGKSMYINPMQCLLGDLNRPWTPGKQKYTNHWGSADHHPISWPKNNKKHVTPPRLIMKFSHDMFAMKCLKSPYPILPPWNSGVAKKSMTQFGMKPTHLHQGTGSMAAPQNGDPVEM